MEARTKQEKFDLLEDTKKYYTEDVTRRSVTPRQHCAYSGATLNKVHSDGCAIGRLLDEELKLYLDRCYKNKNVSDIWVYLPETVTSYGRPFLKHLQSFHDSPLNWNENGLTICGEEEYSLIKSRINIEAY